MGIRNLLTKILGKSTERVFVPNYDDSGFIKIFLKENNTNIVIEENENLFVLLASSNLQLSHNREHLYIGYDEIYDLYVSDGELIEDYKMLNLPDIFSGYIYIDNKGNFNQDKEVKYGFSFNDGINYDISIFKNNILRVNSEFMILPKDMYEFLNELREYNRNSQKSEDIGEQFSFLASIKDYADKTNILLNRRLREEEKPIVLDKVTLDFIDNGKAIEVIPLINEYNEELNKAFLNKFDSEDRVRNFYNVNEQGKNVKVIFKNKESAKMIKRNRVLKGKQKEEFLTGNNEIFESEDFDLSKYGPRVVGMGFLKYRANAAPSNKKDESWFDMNKNMELPKLSTNEESFTLHPDDRKYLQNKVREIELSDSEFTNVELEKEGQTFKIPMTKEQIEGEIEKINSSIVEVEYINNLDALKSIKEKMKEKPRNLYIEHNGRYIRCLDKNVIDDKIVKLQEKQDTKKTKKGDDKVLIIKENLDNIEYIEESKEIKNYELEVPKSLLYDLFDHQKIGVNKLQNLYRTSNVNGILLADDMGLGKTLQILTFLAWLQEKYDVTPSLVVCPSTLIDNWDNEDINNKGEIQKAFKENTFKTYKIRGRIKESDFDEINSSDIVFISYESLRINQLALGRIHWKSMICDEVQKAKNATTLVSIALKAQNADFKIACSATPIENTAMDLWSIMDFAVPGILGSHREFKKNFVNKINRLNEYDINERENLNNYIVERIENNFIRRSKEDELKGLPKKYIKVYKIPANGIEISKIRQLNDLRADGEQALPLIQKLIALCSHEDLITKKESVDIKTLINNSSKMLQLKKILDEVKEKNEKVLIFTIFKRMQEILIKAIREWYGINCDIVNGTISQDKRKKAFDRFRKSTGFNAIVLSPEVAGVGITLTEANHVIHYTRLWNPAKEAQATDRAYRIGQKKDVYVHYPILTFEEEENLLFNNENEYIDYFINSSTGSQTPEEKLNKLLTRKKNLLNNFFLAAGSFKADIVKDWDKDEYTKEDNINIINIFNAVNADEFESLCSILYRNMNYSTYLTRKSCDKGVDVVAVKNDFCTLIQCKMIKGRSLSKDALNEVFGAKNVYENNMNKRIEELVVITTAEEITRDAQVFSEGNNVRIILKKELASLLEKYDVYYDDVVNENENRYSFERLVSLI